jgi:GrpB-like predicted nucleotidyltransferase (UPF0157 family)
MARIVIEPHSAGWGRDFTRLGRRLRELLGDRALRIDHIGSTAVAAYAELKRRLATELRDIRRYAEVKDPACDLIIAAAEEWAAVTDWEPGSSDA